MLCPVCKSECEQNDVCRKCGFSEVSKIFINQEEAEQWYETIVIPYRNKYDTSTVLPPLDWMDVFKQDPQAKRLFDFSIPASVKRRIDLNSLKNSTDDDYNDYLVDATLGHIAIVSKDETIRRHLLEEISKAYLQTTNFSRTSSACVERKGDLAAVLTELECGSALVFEFNSKMKSDVVKMFSHALSDYHFEVTIGKGVSARNVGIDIYAFTAIFIAESIDDIPRDIRNALNAIIEINPSQEELDELQIREIAPLYGIQLTKATVEIIKQYVAQKTFGNARSILKFVSDYLYLHPEFVQPLNKEQMSNVIALVEGKK